MAVYFHGTRSIDYQLILAPVGHDLVLLQDSAKSSEVWGAIITSLKTLSLGPGRILTCAWHDSSRPEAELVKDLLGFLKAMALNQPFVVANGDAIRAVKALDGLEPGYVQATLLLTQDIARATELEDSIREFLRA